jgi:hypothetical protein
LFWPRGKTMILAALAAVVIASKAKTIKGRIIATFCANVARRFSIEQRALSQSTARIIVV